MTNVIPGMKEAQFSLLFERRRRKNSYQPLEAGAYPRRFIKQLEEAHHAVLTGNLSQTKMVRIDPRSGRYLLSIGFGAKNTWFDNDHIPRGEYVEFGSAAEVVSAIQGLYHFARKGDFDAALEKLRIKRQEHAEMNLPEYDVSLGWLIMRPFFLPRQAPYFHLREPSRSSWG